MGRVSNYIKESLRASSEKLLYNKIAVFVKDPLPKDINLDHVFSSIEKRVPEHLSYGIDMVYVGDFEEFRDRDVNAAYRDGALYITNNQSDEDDMIDAQMMADANMGNVQATIDEVMAAAGYETSEDDDYD